MGSLGLVQVHIFSSTLSLLTTHQQYMGWAESIQLPEQWCNYLVNQCNEHQAQPFSNHLNALKASETRLNALKVSATCGKSGQHARGFNSDRLVDGVEHRVEKTGTSKDIIYL